MTSNDSIVRMPTMTALPDINLEPLHQLAVVRVLEFRANVLEDMPDYDIKDEDLTSDEITKRRKYANTIVEQLNHCIKQENPFYDSSSAIFLGISYDRSPPPSE